MPSHTIKKKARKKKAKASKKQRDPVVDQFFKDRQRALRRRLKGVSKPRENPQRSHSRTPFSVGTRSCRVDTSTCRAGRPVGFFPLAGSLDPWSTPPPSRD